MKLLIVGPRGNMGKFITQIAAARETIEIIGGVAPAGRDYIGKDIGEVAMVGRTLGAPVVDDIEQLIDACDVIIDFSTVEQGMQVLAAARAHRKALICGTTGFSAEQKAAFAAAAEDIPVMLAANTSRLVNVMYKVIEMITRAAGDELDIEILDMHSASKLDAPSGTAHEMGEIVAEALGKDLNDIAVYGHRPGEGRREKGTVAFHSIRGADISSEHTVYFVGEGERIEITHRSPSFKCFAKGVVDCAEFLVNQPKGAYTVQDAFGLN
ncbi:MAG: 4-hydroxy-tetrahydrodipicolinate reductase [Mogibacterium sp.]|nr:4-hydroxy-tetrahydrodipicolinate reductase [Mogibacterium sp.]